MRDRLIALLRQCSCVYMSCDGDCGECKNIEMFDEDIEQIADHLLANSVIVPPCKVGDAVWFIRKNTRKIIEAKVNEIVIKRGGIYLQLSCNSVYETSCKSIGKSVFLTKEEAEKALVEQI